MPRGLGSFGARYGLSVRRRYMELELAQHLKYPCPRCGLKRLVRKGTGIWECTKCGHKLAGGCYVPFPSGA